MSKHDLRARPIFHHTHDATWAHLTVVMAALAVARYLQDTTRISIKRVTGAPLTGSRTARSFLTGDDLNEPGEARVVVVLEGPEGLPQEPRLLRGSAKLVGEGVWAVVMGVVCRWDGGAGPVGTMSGV